MSEDISVVEQAVRDLYIDAFGDMYLMRFNNTSKLVGKIIQESDYSVNDPTRSDFIKNRPLDNTVVGTPSITYSNNGISVGSRSISPVEVASVTRSSIALNLIVFKQNIFYSAGDTVLFNDNYWICTKSGIETANPSISKNFKLTKKYELVEKICELDDTRLSAIITAESVFAQTSYIISDVFDLYFHSKNIELPNNETPENFIDYAIIGDGQLTIGNSKKSPTMLFIYFDGSKTISFDLKVFNMIDNPSVFVIKKNNDELYRFEKDPNSTDMLFNGVAMASDEVINNIVVDLQYGDELLFAYTSSGVTEEVLPILISSLNISY